MLVLTRKQHESITLTDIRTGDEIVVTLCRNGRNAVRIGIEAPRDYQIVRTELLDRTGVESRENAPCVA